jgi:hypothetical protein
VRAHFHAKFALALYLAITLAQPHARADCPPIFAPQNDIEGQILSAKTIAASVQKLPFKEAFETLCGRTIEQAQKRLKIDYVRNNGALWKSALSDFQAMMIHAYTGACFEPLNEVLRKTDRAEAITYSAVTEQLVSALQRLPDHAGWVFRGTSLPPAVLERYQAGATIEHWAFTSTTAGSPFYTGHSIQMKIRSKHGKLIDQYSALQGEREVLFPPHTRFKVLEREVRADGKIAITLEEAERSRR